MRRFSLFVLLVFISTFVNAQDSTSLLTHEIGFNSVSMIKQIISNNPSNTLPQLPYDLFYNLYYKDQFGVRIGLGLSNSHFETEIKGQPLPRTTDQKSLNLRAGLSYNFVRSKKVTLNCFGDLILEKISSETAFTSTIQIFPNPVQSQTNKSSDIINGIGGEIGVGVKYNIVKNLSIYAEVPIVFVTEKTTSETYLSLGNTVQTDKISSKNSVTRIIIPTTIYLVLRF